VIPGLWSILLQHYEYWLSILDFDWVVLTSPLRGPSTARARARIMLALPLSLLLIPALASSAAAAEGCPDPSLTSCSSSASSADACCVLNPGGLVLFSQRFEPDVGGDMGSWGIDTLEVIE
jgi:hypothetical protein